MISLISYPKKSYTVAQELYPIRCNHCYAEFSENFVTDFSGNKDFSDIYGSHRGCLKDRLYFTSIMTLVIGVNFPVLQIWLKVCGSLRIKVEYATAAFSAMEPK